MLLIEEAFSPRQEGCEGGRLRSQRQDRARGNRWFSGRIMSGRNATRFALLAAIALCLMSPAAAVSVAFYNLVSIAGTHYLLQDASNLQTTILSCTPLLLGQLFAAYFSYHLFITDEFRRTNSGLIECAELLSSKYLMLIDPNVIETCFAVISAVFCTSASFYVSLLEYRVITRLIPT
ncbi:MAG: hypothetical protein ABSF67_01095 [Roseiarcus sp.]|jgi:hypothetical protein